jgi:hypothetical protein
MKTSRTASRRRAWRLYAAGQATILLGAGAMSALHSYAPMALGASAGLMLSVPLIRDIAAGRRARA